VKLIVGLGNPGERYEGSRHNLGADVVSQAARRLEIDLTHVSHEAQWGRGRADSADVILALPLTYMNLSGRAVLALSQYYKIQLDDILVVSDDLNLPLGRLRFRRGGSAGGHNGLKSIIEQFGSEDFHRLRVGIGRPGGEGQQVDFVLSRFLPEERAAVKESTERGAEGVLCWLREDLDAAMRAFNR